MLIILAANVGSWFLGSFAVYFVKVYLYTGVFISNIVLGIAIFAFHTTGNPRVMKIKMKIGILILLFKANQMIRKLFRRLC